MRQHPVCLSAATPLKEGNERGTALAGGWLEVGRWLPVRQHPVCLSAATPLKEGNERGTALAVGWFRSGEGVASSETLRRQGKTVSSSRLTAATSLEEGNSLSISCRKHGIFLDVCGYTAIILHRLHGCLFLLAS
ncbi:MAG: hypothetical protein Q4E67_00235 [Planctomycetia bacterium]|nr:hypothetical protein [Planctomycetia bacterium]